MAEILIWLTTGAWLLRLFSAWGQNRRHIVSESSAVPLVARLFHLRAIDLGVIVWLILGVLSLAWSEQAPQAMTELRVMMLEPFLFYLMFRLNVRDKQSIIRIVDAMLVAGFVVAVIGLWLFILGDAVITAEGGALRLASVYGSPNNVALFLGRCIPFTLAYLILSGDRVRQFAAGISFAVMLLAVLLTQSVGGLLLGVPASIATVFVLIWQRRAGLAIAGLAAGILAISPLLFQSARFTRLLDFSQGTNFFRIRVWQSAINMIRDHPLTGVGLDQFLYAFRGRYIMPDAWQEPNLSHPHNIVLDFWTRLGVLGVVSFLWLQVFFWKAMCSIFRRFRGNDRMLFALSVGTIGSMINLLSHGLVDNSVYVHDLCYVYVLLLGLATNLSNIRTIDESGEIMV
jgi:O-antigen ligase